MQGWVKKTQVSMNSKFIFKNFTWEIIRKSWKKMVFMGKWRRKLWKSVWEAWEGNLNNLHAVWGRRTPCNGQEKALGRTKLCQEASPGACTQSRRLDQPNAGAWKPDSSNQFWFLKPISMQFWQVSLIPTCSNGHLWLAGEFYSRRIRKMRPLNQVLHKTSSI